MTPLYRLRKTIRRLTALCDREHQLLRARDYSALGESALRKSNLLAQLGAAIDAAETEKVAEDLNQELAALRKQCIENARQFEALIAGTKAARERLAALREKRDSVTLYARDGATKDAGRSASLNTHF